MSHAPPYEPLPLDEVHVWQASLQLPANRMEQLYETLSNDERGRADGYRFVRERHRFVAARAWLRAILSRYLGTRPSDVCFTYTPHGKPELAGPSGMHSPYSCPALPSAQPAIQFNLSHCDDLALYAVAYNRRVGIDVERIRAGFADDVLAESFFSPQEVEALRALPAAEQQPAFFTCWTRKEAYLKARGEGLIIPLDSFAVSLAPTNAALLRTPDPTEMAHWRLCDLDVGPDYVAALAVEGAESVLRRRQAQLAMLGFT